ncbi:hypothetical protein M501DRAFT_584784 [Patellaria atrata CBS 101060]|uniref:Uncharacterized protein n=1 Tax=Patellaria atrata CBS 101060 TaxID=1346257 RepID=A0A9P4SF49_9PEZI|nr:hypothetical protein M501DRAFT_584784 [Patellaria atrata CBS 101060]
MKVYNLYTFKPNCFNLANIVGGGGACDSTCSVSLDGLVLYMLVGYSLVCVVCTCLSCVEVVLFVNYEAVRYLSTAYNSV